MAKKEAEVKVKVSGVEKVEKDIGGLKGELNDVKNVGDELNKQFGLLPGPLNKVISSFQGISKAANIGTGSMKLLKVAIASTGIGLLLTAVASLIQYFKRTEEGASKLQQILAPFKVIFQNILDIVGKFGGVIVSAFENPKKAINDLWDTLKQNLINRIEASIDVFRGLGKVIEGVFKLDISQIKQGAEEAGNAFVDTFTGVRDTIGKATDAIKDFAEESRRETEIAVQLEKDKLKLQQDRRKYQEEEAEGQRRISELLLKSRDLELSAAERQKALVEAKNIQNSLSDEAVRLAQEDLRIKEESAKLSDSDAQTLQEITDAKVALSNVERERNTKLKTYTQQENTLIKEQEALTKKQIEDKKKAAEEEEKINKELNDKILSAQRSLNEKLNDYAISQAETEQEQYDLKIEKENERFETYLETLGGNQELIRIAEEEHKLELQKLEDEYNNNIIESDKKRAEEQKKIDDEVVKQKIKNQQVISGLAKQLSGLFEENTVAHKLFASASIILDSVMAIQRALVDYPPPNPIGIASVATIGATAAVGLSKVNSVSFGSGGILNGPSHAQGGILTPFGELEGGEGVINKISMSNPSLRNLASAINQAGGGKSFGIGDGSVKLSDDTISLIVNGINDKKVFVLESDITEKQSRVKVYEDNSIL
ncbi:MAG: hypothetical protein KC589_09125 [Nanoarchaeota archaeon]|nr:hypothetical protein [Nanoarchaeota archaeon]